MTYKTEAIILRSFDIKEYDRIYVIFSREYGKMRILGIGARKPMAKLASGLEPLTRSEIFLVRGRKLDRAKGVIICAQYPELKKRLELLDGAKKTVKIIDELAPEREQSGEIYEALAVFLDYSDGAEIRNGVNSKSGNKSLSDRIGTAKLLQAGLLWKVVRWSGQEPKLFQCARCNSKLARQESYLFSFPSGILCGKCGSGHSGAGMKMTENTVKLLRVFLFKDFRLLAKVKASKNTLMQALGATRMMLENLLGRRVEL